MNNTFSHENQLIGVLSTFNPISDTNCGDGSLASVKYEAEFASESSELALCLSSFPHPSVIMIVM